MLPQYPGMYEEYRNLVVECYCICLLGYHGRYHGSTVVDFDSLRGGISLETEKTGTGTTSRLMLTRASLRDSGNYTCVPAGALPASVRVHVLTGKRDHPF